MQGRCDMPNARIAVDDLYAALDEQRRSRDMSWRAVARELEISASTMTRLSNGLRPDADTFAAMVAWLNMPADSYITRDEEPETRQEPDVLVEVQALLRSRKDLDEDQREMLAEVLRAAYRHVQPRT